MKSRKEKDTPRCSFAVNIVTILCLSTNTATNITAQQEKHIIKHDIEIKLNDLINNFL